MTLFSMSRLHTQQGIFRLTGHYCCDVPVNPESLNIEVETIDLMGTDGWISLDLSATMTQQLLQQLEPELVNHLFD